MHPTHGRRIRNSRSRGAMLPILALCLGLIGTATLADDERDLVTGGGVYLLSGTFEIDLTLYAERRADGTVFGNFRQSLTFQGQPIDFHGDVICFEIDSDNGRAWIGGVVRENFSTHPSFTTEIHQPGKDVWFRVLDSDLDSDGDSDSDSDSDSEMEPDRTTFLGFEGGGGIITSEEYCALQIWPDNNDRTHPMINGEINVEADD